MTKKEFVQYYHFLAPQRIYLRVLTTATVNKYRLRYPSRSISKLVLQQTSDVQR